MKREGLVHLTVERSGDEFLVSSVEFPLLNVIVDDKEEISSLVLPILKEMMEHDMKTNVSLRMVESVIPQNPTRRSEGRGMSVRTALAMLIIGILIYGGLAAFAWWHGYRTFALIIGVCLLVLVFQLGRAWERR